MSDYCEGTWRETWKAMEDIFLEGMGKSGNITLRAIGVSNFNEVMLTELLQIARVKPAVVQNRHDPLHTDWEVIELCRREGIFYQSFSTLGRQWLQGRQPTREDPNPVLGHPTVLEISQRYGKTAAQIVLKWALKSGLGVIPKSSKEDRMRSNLDLFSFDLTSEDMLKLYSCSLNDRPPNDEEVSLIVKNRSGRPLQWYWSRRGMEHRWFCSTFR